MEPPRQIQNLLSYIPPNLILLGRNLFENLCHTDVLRVCGAPHKFLDQIPWKEKGGQVVKRRIVNGVAIHDIFFLSKAIFTKEKTERERETLF